MYNCSKCGRDIEEPKDATIRAVRCQCGNMVSFSDAVTMVPHSASISAATSEYSGEILIPGYRIVRKIGEGGMGAVYEAVQESLGRRVAVKILPGNLASDPQFVKRFEREAGTLSQLRHPNIVGIIDRGSVGETYYFVMEYVVDVDSKIVTLQDLINRHELDKNSVLRFTREIAAALVYAHSKGIIHRDIKPANIMIDELSAARVVDFGIAQILGDDQNRRLHLTMTGEAIGTPQYMSPEQRTDATKSDARSDIYSLGVMVYEMLTGGFPEGAWDPPSELGCDPGWDSIIETSIRKLPDRRFQTMSDFLSSLDTIGTGTLTPKKTTSPLDKKEEHYRTPVPTTSILGKCPGCGVENPGDNRFCSGCGASLYESCPACQGEIRVGLHFCGKCGIDIPKQKRINELRDAISKALVASSVEKNDILAATEILLEAMKLEESLVKLSVTGGGNIQPLTVHVALDRLWDEKALASEIFPSSGIEHIEFLCRISKELPERKDIQFKIEELSSERDNLLKELKTLFNGGHFLSLMQTVSKTRWGEYAEIASVVAEARERFAKANKLVNSQIPKLIEGKYYYKLDKVLAELEGLNASIDGLSELRKETDAILYQAKQRYEHAIRLESSKEILESMGVLEKLLASCSDYPDAEIKMPMLQKEVGDYLKLLEEAKRNISLKKYKIALGLLEPLLLKLKSNDLNGLIGIAREGAGKAFKRKLRLAAVLILSFFSLIFLFLAVNKYLHYKALTSANFAFSNKEYDKAIELYNKAFNIPGYANDVNTKKLREEAQTTLERKTKFDNAITEGKYFLEGKDWIGAQKAFTVALKVPGYENNDEAIYSLKKCDAYFAEKGKKDKDAFNNAVSEGTKALSSKNYAEALKSFKAALTIPGYETNETAIKQRDEAKLNMDRKNQFDSTIKEGKECLDNKDWDGAEKAFRNARSIPGYDDNKEVLDSIKAAQDGKLSIELQIQFENAVDEGNKFLKSKDWTKAEKAFKTALSIPGYENDSDAIACLRAAQEGPEIQKKQSNTNWNDTKTKVNVLLSDLKNNSLNVGRRIKSADSALALLEIISDSDDMLYLSDSSKNEISALKSQIISLQSKLVRIPFPGFEMLKGSAIDTNYWASQIRHKDTGIEMVYVVPGEFMMGSLPSEIERTNDETQHKVNLTMGYYIGKYEVTQWQWEKVTGSNPSGFKDVGKDAPVEHVNWDDCQEFIKKLNDKKSSALVFRLPTEAEWEYACRGGKASKGFEYSGSNTLEEVAWFKDNSGGKTHPVGNKKPNELGLYDMSGNVWEWCSDWYGEYSKESEKNPQGGKFGTARILRGGCWDDEAWGCRFAFRLYFAPTGRVGGFGFRLVLTPGQE